MVTSSDSNPKTQNNESTEVIALREEVAVLKHELAWFKKQMFGSKSEKRLEECPDQLRLFERKQTPAPANGPTEQITYTRGKGKKTAWR